MRTDVTRAKQAMDSIDIEPAGRYVDQAHRELEKLEVFLGNAPPTQLVNAAVLRQANG